MLGEGHYRLAKILLSLAHFQDNFLGEAKRRNIWWKLFVLAGVCWSLWKAKNEWLFANTLAKTPLQVVSKIKDFLQHWRLDSLDAAGKDG